MRLEIIGWAVLFGVQALAGENIPPQFVGAPDAYRSVTNRAFTGIPSLTVTRKGRMWATWYAGPTPNEDSNNYVVLSTSGDNGKTWKEIFVVDPDKNGPRRTFDPEVWVMPDNKLRWSWTDRDDGKTAAQSLWLMVLPDADEIPPAVPSFSCIARGLMMCKPIILSSGEWALPVARWYEEKSSAVFVSTDQGKTFTYRGAATIQKRADRLYDEHLLIEKKNGDLWCLTRGANGFWESVSKDKGATWPDMVPARIQQPSARMFATRLISGNLLLVKHGPPDKQIGRSHLTAFLSKDDGETWQGGLLLDERGGISYPDGVQRPDGTIFITYDFDRVGAKEILFTTFTEADVLAGKDVSGKVTLRQIISKGLKVRPAKR